MSNEIPLMVTRTQWAAGQGFFHSCVLHSYGKPFVYIFDCGSKGNSKTGSPDTISTIKQEIDQFATSLNHRWPEWPEWLEWTDWPEWLEWSEWLELPELPELLEWLEWQKYKFVNFYRHNPKFKDLVEAKYKFAPTFIGIPFETEENRPPATPQPKKPTIDIVYISHFDDDHINGLEHLLNKTHIKEVSIPYTTPTERFIYLLKGTANERGELQTSDLLDISDFTLQFVANPRAALAQQSNETTLQGDENDNGDYTTAIYATNNTQTGSYNLSSTPSQRRPTKPIWTLFAHTLRGNIREIEDKFKEALLKAIRKHNNSSQNTVEDIPTTGEQEAPNEIPQEEDSLEQIDFKNPATLRNLLSSKYIEAIKEAYKAVIAPSTDLNITSLILYSGPVEENEYITTFYAYLRGNKSMQHYYPNYTPNLTHNSSACGWIGCGDAPIGKKKDEYLEDFTRTFRSFKRMTSTFAPPHHGSKKDWDDNLLTGFGPSEKDAPICVFSANSLRWDHPSTRAIISANSVGSPTIVVTNDIRSRFTETIAVFVRID